jgi:hypothetical protein
MRLAHLAPICSHFGIMTDILDDRKCKMLLRRERNMLKQLMLDNSEYLLRYISDSGRLTKTALADKG